MSAYLFAWLHVYFHGNLNWETKKQGGKRERLNKDKTERQWQEQRKEVSKKKVTETDTEVDEGLKVGWTVWPSVWLMLLAFALS